ncbi:MAG: DUF6794 domain-containing protein [Cyclobacteriaceae bacterium]
MRYILLSLLIQLPIFLFGQGLTRQELKNKPKNLDECIAKLDLMLTDADKDTIRSMDEDDFAISQHFNLGIHMRNYWGLWRKKGLYHFFDSLGVTHPDNMSGIILVSFHRHLNDKTIDLDGQIRELNAEIQEMENQVSEGVSNSKNIWNSIQVGDTVLINFRIDKAAKKPGAYFIYSYEQLDQIDDKYDICTFESVVTDKNSKEEGDPLLYEFNLEIRILEMCGNEHLKLWYPFNKTKIGDVITYNLLGKNIRKNNR